MVWVWVKEEWGVLGEAGKQGYLGLISASFAMETRCRGPCWVHIGETECRGHQILAVSYITHTKLMSNGDIKTTLVGCVFFYIIIYHHYTSTFGWVFPFLAAWLWNSNSFQSQCCWLPLASSVSFCRLSPLG